MPAFTSRRRHGGRWWGIGTTLAAAVVALVFTLAASGAKPGGGTPSGPFLVPNGPLSVSAGFEGNDADTPPRSAVPDDGKNPPTSAPTNGGGYTINFDWNSLKTTQTYTGTAPYQTATGTTNGWLWTALTDDQKSTTDTGFGGGVKQDDSCAAVVGGSAPNKDDLKRAYLATKVVGGHTYLELGWVRIPQNTTSSSAHIAFEFNQGGSTCPSSASDGLVPRMAGDLLLLYDFTGGSTVPPHVTLSRWVTSGACGVASHSAPCWGTFTDLELTTPISAEANVDTGLSHLCQGTTGCGPNENDISGAGGAGTTYVLPSSTSDSLAPATETLGASEFGEATVDLTNAGVFTSGSCVSFGQVEAVSRSSGDSGTAAMEDLVGPGSFTLSNCTTSVGTQMQSSSDNSTFTDISDGASLTSGTYVRDKATVTVSPVTTWSGSVAFYLCYSATTTLASCKSTDTGATHITPDKTLTVTNGVGSIVATSNSTQVNAAGSYCWAAYFTSTSPTGLPNAKSETGECFTVTAPTSIATNPFYYPQDRATISASSGGDLAGSVAFRLYDNSTHCNATDNVDTVGTNGLLYKETGVSVAGTSPQSVNTSNTNFRVTATTAAMYWKVTYTTTNNAQTGSSSVCVENIADTITADGTVTFP
jgi:hypothetical protein